MTIVITIWLLLLVGTLISVAYRDVRHPYPKSQTTVSHYFALFCYILSTAILLGMVIYVWCI